ncbi:MAG: hypothetical protein WCY11_04610 [Novosphingobium sp.]
MDGRILVPRTESHNPQTREIPEDAVALTLPLFANIETALAAVETSLTETLRHADGTAFRRTHRRRIGSSPGARRNAAKISDGNSDCPGKRPPPRPD